MPDTDTETRVYGLERQMAQISEILATMQQLATHMDSQMTALRAEMRQDMTALRAEMRQDMTDLRTELRQDMKELRQEKWPRYATSAAILAIPVSILVLAVSILSRF